jgi:hypothetical protein
MWEENFYKLVQVLTMHLHGGTQKTSQNLRQGNRCLANTLYIFMVHLMSPSTYGIERQKEQRIKNSKDVEGSGGVLI